MSIRFFYKKAANRRHCRIDSKILFKFGKFGSPLCSLCDLKGETMNLHKTSRTQPN